ncbi:hypothetical protein [Lysobacter fragariae]
MLPSAWPLHRYTRNRKSPAVMRDVLFAGSTLLAARHARIAFKDSAILCKFGCDTEGRLPALHELARRHARVALQALNTHKSCHAMP